MAATLRRWLDAAARPAVVQPLSAPVAADDAAYWRRKGPLTLAIRNARRLLQLAASGQAGTLCERVDPDWKSCLWIHTEAPQVGDALMDLAPRSLLRDHGIEIDLLAAPHLVALFTGDRWFRHSHVEGHAPDAANYDFTIVSSHARRALQSKTGGLRKLPWISLAGFYSVPDYHRGAFNARRLADALGGVLSDAAMRLHSRQKLDPVDIGREPSSPGPRPLIGLALGGVHPSRTYRHWPAVVAALRPAGVRSFVLAGSANGLQAKHAIAASAPVDTVLHDGVARSGLVETRGAIAGCDLFVCADGGLMHLALTTSTPVLALFTAAIDPAWRLPLDFEGCALRSGTLEVSDIPPGEVAAAALHLTGRAQRQQSFEDAFGDQPGPERTE